MNTDETQVQKYVSTSKKAQFIQKKIEKLPKEQKWLEEPLEEMVTKSMNGVVDKIIVGELHVDDSKNLNCTGKLFTVSLNHL